MSDRTPQDYAIEHAEYMAVRAEELLDAMNEHAAALMDQEENGGTSQETDEALTERCELAEQVLAESMSSLRNRIYEFRKRRDRAAANPTTTQASPIPARRTP